MSDSCCGCGNQLELKALQAEQRRTLTIVFWINVTTFVMMALAAFYSGSSSLLSGSLDNFGDALTYALSLAVIAASPRAKSQVAFVKGMLILGAAVAVAIRIAWGVSHPGVPIVEAMSGAALINLGANLVCLRLLTPYRHGDVNLASAWECSRNDIYEGCAVIVAAAGVWMFDASWPDLVVAVTLLFLFSRSAWSVFTAALRGYRLSSHSVVH